MTKELGETSDPTELVPGNPNTVTTAVTAMRGYGDALHDAGAGLARIDVTSGWSGPAGNAFRQVFHGQPGKWSEAGDCFHNAANALETYSHTLIWAQGQAGDAITLWNAGQAATNQARTQHRQAEQQAGHSLPFDDTVGSQKRTAAQNNLNRARGQLSTAADTADKAVGAARDKAPKKPGFWSKVGHFFEDAGADIANATGTIVNAGASSLNAMAHHPGDVGMMVLSAAGMAAGGVGVAGSGVLDATGVLTVPGVAVGAGSIGLIGVSTAAMASAGGDLSSHASGDDSASPMRTDRTGAPDDSFQPDEGFRGSEYSKDEFVEFANGHTDDGNPAMGSRPTRAEIEAALDKAEPIKPANQMDPNSVQEQFDYKGVRVIVNYSMPWKTTAYYPGK
jgi:type VII secretion system ESX-1 substrate